MGRKGLLHSISDKTNVTQGRPLGSLVSHLVFWKKREAEKPSEPERIIPLPNLSAPAIQVSPTESVESVDRVKNALKVLKLERQIIGSAVTTIYESHSKGVISQAERDCMLEKYKVDLKRLEISIEENQRVVDLHDLELEREQITKSFNAKLAEIDAKLKNLKSGSAIQKAAKDVTDGGKGSHESQDNPSQGSYNNDPVLQPVNDSEKRIEQIREEIQQAMNRLEQIETEG